MYALLREGAFGNTTQSWMSVADWLADPASNRKTLWGLRSLTPDERGAYLDVPTHCVIPMADRWGGLCNISEMIDRWMIFRAEVWDGPAGWCVQGTTDLELKWKDAFRDTLKRWEGIAARRVLQHYMSPDSYQDLEAVFDLYPGHVAEFTVCSREIGKIPGRNAVVWECRDY